MRKLILSIALATALVPGVAGASSTDVTFDASPNPARVGDRVVHKLHAPFSGVVKIWVSARGFKQPGSGTLPPGTWSWVCCPVQTAGTPAWHYRSAAPVAAGGYRFGAVAKIPGSYLSTAAVWNVTDAVWVKVR